MKTIAQLLLIYLLSTLSTVEADGTVDDAVPTVIPSAVQQDSSQSETFSNAMQVLATAAASAVSNAAETVSTTYAADTAPTPATSSALTTFISSASSPLSAAQSQPTSQSQQNGANNQVSTNDGAAGTSGGSFHLGVGGLLAICIVVFCVVIFGIVTLALWIIAKRRNMSVRETIRRGSRRITGHFDRRRDNTKARAAARPRVGFADDENVKAKASSRAVPPYHPKYGAGVNTGDVENAMAGRRQEKYAWNDPLAGKAPTQSRNESGWVKTLWGNGWK